ncbi:MAG: replication-associated recombination protein A [Bacteroidota bacterium]
MVHPPLAERMRPTRPEDLLGQEELVGPQGLLKRFWDDGALPSLILWGPPGSGKTSLARMLAQHSKRRFRFLSAVDAGVKEVRAVIEEGNGLFKPLLFLDEIHRFNKAQQDTLLGAIESGQLTLIGATTENPSFGLNPALLSRCQLLILQSLRPETLHQLAQQAVLKDPVLQAQGLELVESQALVRHAQGDARRMYNLLEWLAGSLEPEQGVRRITNEAVLAVLPHFAVYHDRDGDNHYRLISALIKSVRGSDPQAAVYYLARLVQGGEDPVFIARRLVLLASEDIGLANPQALVLASATMDAVARIGYPEARIPLSQTTLYLSLSPKSNSAYLAIDAALNAVRQADQQPTVPEALSNPVTSMQKDLGYGQGYQYSHEGPHHFIHQNFMPEALRGRVFYQPAANDRERGYQRWLQEHWPEYPLQAETDQDPPRP